MTTPPKRRATTNRRPRIFAGAAVGVLVLALLAALLLHGGDDTRAAAGSPSGAATSTVTSAPGTGTGTPGTSKTPKSTPTASASTPSPGAGTEDAITTPTDLEPFLLRGSDLPVGWRTLDSAVQATSTLMGSCLAKAITPTVPHVSRTTSFRSGSNGPVLTAAVRDFSTSEQSARAWTAVSSAVRACTTGTGKPSLTRITVTTRADAALGVTFVLTQAGSSARGEVLVAKVGARSATLALVGLTEQDLALGRKALDTMIARLG